MPGEILALCDVRQRYGTLEAVGGISLRVDASGGHLVLFGLGELGESVAGVVYTTATTWDTSATYGASSCGGLTR